MISTYPWRTLRFIQLAHVDQFDKGGIPYWKHPFRVGCRARAVYRGGEHAFHAGLLHDVIEDTHYTFADLHEWGFPNEVLDAVRRVTRPPLGSKRPSYMDWIRSIADSDNFVAICVKLADLDDNSDPVRVARLPENMRGIVRRYEESKTILLPVWQGMSYRLGLRQHSWNLT